MKSTILFVFLFISSTYFAQKDSVWSKAPNLNFSGLVDVFYVYDFNQPNSNKRQDFFCNYNRHNEFNLNLALFKVNLQHDKYRANLAFQAGTYSIDNYKSVPGLLKNIFEANVGISLNKKNNLWLDAGIFASHIGFESAIGMDNWTMTRSILAENTPYYLNGAKLTYNPTQKIEIAGIICNGWQRIQRLLGNSLPAFGTQFKYKANDNISLNWSTFASNEFSDEYRKMRYFNNFFAQLQLTKKWGIIAGFDIGNQQIAKKSKNYDSWYSPIIIAQYKMKEKWKLAARFEYYNDQNQVMISTISDTPFKVLGYSLNADYSPIKNILCRLEARLLTSEYDVFVRKNSTTYLNFFVGSSIAIKLEK